MEEVKFITLRVTPSFDRALRVAAARHDQNRSEFIRQVLSERLVELSEPSTIAHQVKREAAP